MSRKNYIRLLHGGLLASAAMWAPSALAESLAADAEPGFADNEIVVTARKVPERAIDAPLSVTVISADTIKASGARSTFDLVATAPNAAISACASSSSPAS